MPKVGTGPGDTSLSNAGQEYVIPVTLLRLGHSPSPGYLAAPGQPAPKLPKLALSLAAPTHRHPVRVFLPNLFTFLFPILEGVVLLILELHDGPQDVGAPPTGPAARAGDCVSRLATPSQCQPYHNRSTRVSSHAPVAALRGQTSGEGPGDPSA